MFNQFRTATSSTSTPSVPTITMFSSEFAYLYCKRQEGLHTKKCSEDSSGAAGVGLETNEVSRCPTRPFPLQGGRLAVRQRRRDKGKDMRDCNFFLDNIKHFQLVLLPDDHKLADLSTNENQGSLQQLGLTLRLFLPRAGGG